AVFFLFLLLSRRLHAENKIFKKILEVLDQLRQVSSTPASLVALSLSSAIIWMMDVTICYLVSMMFGVTIPFMLVLLAIVIGNLVKAVPITPGGIGTYELALVITFEIGGVPAATATLIAVVDHLIKNLVTLAGGVVSLYYFGDWAVSLLKRLFHEDAKKLKEEHGSS
ncbi:MAG TPA: lysylphosphatidylglycerol synthase transmembrane domain-containing protein, partial [Methanocorpusculum sp.]|nr:lysylphosphatidylglycerol synthase transmembrane domain-containing protein [Methanocorpusculum sp.]